MYWSCFAIVLCWFMNSADSQYECGQHGRFEYCIDAIPGCVIGCHCHPGYYFDSESKICEPNTKLSQDYRRSFLPMPTRIISMTTSAPSTINIISSYKTQEDKKIEEITNDADELGDWLYNQFFKTIENQVINKTSDPHDTAIITRRSGSNPQLVPTRRSGKHRRNKKKSKKQSMKSKMLRITENDSLFDSSSDDSSSYEDYSSSSSSSSESECDKDHVIKKKPSRHGHKKILIYNKKPKPPLPSFIFLPNMETPFYPPIGLPPPPAVPMYPMVPVPPVMGPMFPYPGMGPYDNNNQDATPGPTPPPQSTNSPQAPTSAQTATAATTNAQTPSTANMDEGNEPLPDVPQPGIEEEKVPDENITLSPDAEPGAETTPKETGRSRYRHRPKMKQRGPTKRPASNQAARTKFMQKLRDKMNRKKTLENFMAGPDETNFMEALGDAFKPPPPRPPSPDTNFKYLSELIHKKNLNNTHRVPFMGGELFGKTSPNLFNDINSRRMYVYNDDNNMGVQLYPQQEYNSDTIPKRQPYDHEITDSYYTNLGKQIATVIKKIDQTATNKVDIEIEREPTQNHQSTNPLFGTSFNSPHFYFERSIRSPLLKFTHFNKNIAKESNEDLYKLENKVFNIASTISPMSLQDLETIIYNIKKSNPAPATDILKYKKKNTNNASPSKLRLSVNLLPKENQFRKDLTSMRQQYTPMQEIMKVLNDNSSEISDLYQKYPTKLKPQFNLPGSTHRKFMYKPVFQKVTNEHQMLPSPNGTYAENQSFNFSNNHKDVDRKLFDYVKIDSEYQTDRSAIRYQIPVLSKAKKYQYQKISRPSYFHYQPEGLDYFEDWH